mgnify:CR=1 FL=1
MDFHSQKLSPEKHILNIIKTTKDHHPNFSLFLGAGASITSGIKSASDMITEWRKQHFDLHGDEDESFEDHFKQFHWYNSSDEYAYLFETLYDQTFSTARVHRILRRSRFPFLGVHISCQSHSETLLQYHTHN